MGGDQGAATQSLPDRKGAWPRCENYLDASAFFAAETQIPSDFHAATGGRSSGFAGQDAAAPVGWGGGGPGTVGSWTAPAPRPSDQHVEGKPECGAPGGRLSRIARWRPDGARADRRICRDRAGAPRPNGPRGGS